MKIMIALAVLVGGVYLMGGLHMSTLQPPRGSTIAYGNFSALVLVISTFLFGVLTAVLDSPRAVLFAFPVSIKELLLLLLILFLRFVSFAVTLLAADSELVNLSCMAGLFFVDVFLSSNHRVSSAKNVTAFAVAALSSTILRYYVFEIGKMKHRHPDTFPTLAIVAALCEIGGCVLFVRSKYHIADHNKADDNNEPEERFAGATSKSADVPSTSDVSTSFTLCLVVLFVIAFVWAFTVSIVSSMGFSRDDVFFSLGTPTASVRGDASPSWYEEVLPPLALHVLFCMAMLWSNVTLQRNLGLTSFALVWHAIVASASSFFFRSRRFSTGFLEPSYICVRMLRVRGFCPLRSWRDRRLTS